MSAWLASSSRKWQSLEKHKRKPVWMYWHRHFFTEILRINRKRNQRMKEQLLKAFLFPFWQQKRVVFLTLSFFLRLVLQIVIQPTQHYQKYDNKNKSFMLELHTFLTSLILRNVFFKNFFFFSLREIGEWKIKYWKKETKSLRVLLNQTIKFIKLKYIRVFFFWD